MANPGVSDILFGLLFEVGSDHRDFLLNQLEILVIGGFFFTRRSMAHLVAQKVNCTLKYVLADH